MASKFQKAENKCLFWAQVGGILFFLRWKRLFYLCVFQKRGTYWFESNFLGNEACKIKAIFKTLGFQICFFAQQQHFIKLWL